MDDNFLIKMNTKNIEINYDKEAGILEIFVSIKPSYFNEIEDDLFEGKDKETNEITGYKIFNLTKRTDSSWMKKIKIPFSM